MIHTQFFLSEVCDCVFLQKLSPGRCEVECLCLALSFPVDTGKLKCLHLLAYEIFPLPLDISKNRKNATSRLLQWVNTSLFLAIKHVQHDTVVTNPLQICCIARNIKIAITNKSCFEFHAMRHWISDLFVLRYFWLAVFGDFAWICFWDFGDFWRFWGFRKFWRFWLVLQSVRDFCKLHRKVWEEGTKCNRLLQSVLQSVGGFYKV